MPEIIREIKITIKENEGKSEVWTETNGEFTLCEVVGMFELGKAEYVARYTFPASPKSISESK